MSDINKKNENYKKENYHQKKEDEVDWLNECDDIKEKCMQIMINLINFVFFVPIVKEKLK